MCLIHFGPYFGLTYGRGFRSRSLFSFFYSSWICYSVYSYLMRLSLLLVAILQSWMNTDLIIHFIGFFKVLLFLGARTNESMLVSFLFFPLRPSVVILCSTWSYLGMGNEFYGICEHILFYKIIKIDSILAWLFSAFHKILVPLMLLDQKKNYIFALARASKQTQKWITLYMHEKLDYILIVLKSL